MKKMKMKSHVLYKYDEKDDKNQIISLNVQFEISFRFYFSDFSFFSLLCVCDIESIILNFYPRKQKQQKDSHQNEIQGENF